MTIKIYVGDINNDLAEIAMADNPTARSIDQHSYKEFIDIVTNPSLKEFYTGMFGSIVGYTSLADLPKLSENNNNNVVCDVLNLADKIYYHPPKVWSDATMQQLTELILQDFSLEKNNVYNLNLPNYTELYTKLVDGRRTPDQQLWISGCSVSHGVGVTQEQRYGQLIADSLGLPVSFLTEGGSSIPWAVDQLPREMGIER